VVTRGIRLNGLVGREFAIGRVRCVGVRLCEPCATLERYTQRTILRPLVHRGGLRADVLDRDEIRVGDPIAVRR
jgi:MOSC domain-containing protein YiiM